MTVWEEMAARHFRGQVVLQLLGGELNVVPRVKEVLLLALCCWSILEMSGEDRV